MTYVEYSVVSKMQQQWYCSNNLCTGFCGEQNVPTMMLCKQPIYSDLWWAECNNSYAVQTAYVQCSVVSRTWQQWCCANNLFMMICGEQNATTMMLCKQPMSLDDFLCVQVARVRHVFSLWDLVGYWGEGEVEEEVAERRGSSQGLVWGEALALALVLYKLYKLCELYRLYRLYKLYKLYELYELYKLWKLYKLYELTSGRPESGEACR